MGPIWIQYIYDTISFNSKPNFQKRLPNSPSDSQIAQEFVRQYFTVMHKNSRMLYRFYGSESVMQRADLK